MQVFARDIENNTLLQMLKLYLNLLSPNGSKQLLCAPQRNHTLKDVEIGCFEMDNEVFIESAPVSSESNTLKKLSLMGYFDPWMDPATSLDVVVPIACEITRIVKISARALEVSKSIAFLKMVLSTLSL